MINYFRVIWETFTRVRTIMHDVKEIKATMTTKADLQETVTILKKAFGEITGEIKRLGDELEAGRDIGTVADELRTLAQDFDALVADAPTEPSDTVTAPEGQDTLTGGTGVDGETHDAEGQIG